MIEAPCRMAYPEEIPLNAQKIAELAESLGWGVAITYARGQATSKLPPTHKSYKEPGIVDSIVVRMFRGGERYVACFIDGSFDSAFSARLQHWSTLRDLKAALA